MMNGASLSFGGGARHLINVFKNPGDVLRDARQHDSEILFTIVVDRLPMFFAFANLKIKELDYNDL